VVSRGYGRRTRGVHVVADREGVKLGPRAAGDEPLLLAGRLPGTPVVVGESRFEAARTAVLSCGATAIVLDDGFQHRSLAKDLEVVAVNGRAPWGNGRLFPRGMLREPLSALRRADLVAVTNPPGPADVREVAAVLRRQGATAPVLVGTYEVVEAREARTEVRAAVADLAGRRFLAFAGLGSPRGFGDTLGAVGVDVAGLVEYPDHHWFTDQDVAELERQARAVGAEGVITTEKDWVRLGGLGDPAVPLWVLAVRLRLDAGRELLTGALSRVLAGAAAQR